MPEVALHDKLALTEPKPVNEEAKRRGVGPKFFGAANKVVKVLFEEELQAESVVS